MNTCRIPLSAFVCLWLCTVGVSKPNPVNLEVFDTVWEHVNQSYYDSEFGGRDWEAIGQEYRDKLPTNRDDAALRVILRNMLNEIGESHFSILAAGFHKDEEASNWQGGFAGMELTRSGDDLVVYRVTKEGPAWKAGIRDGDSILSINGASLGDESSELEDSGLPAYLISYTALQRLLGNLRKPAGESIEITTTSVDGDVQSRVVVLEEYEGLIVPPFGNIGGMPILLEARILPNGVAYLRFSLWFPVVMNDIRAFIGSLEESTPGLIIDLRGNAGGLAVMSGGVAGMLLEEESSLGRTTLRSGHINFVGFPQREAFLGPVAILVDGSSCSTSEIFSIGMQEIGRAKVFGRRTPGAALPSTFTSLPNGDLLQSVLGDFATPSGRTLEAIGVVPDFQLQISKTDLAEGKDSIVEAASDWIINLKSGNHEN